MYTHTPAFRVSVSQTRVTTIRQFKTAPMAMRLNANVEIQNTKFAVRYAAHVASCE